MRTGGKLPLPANLREQQREETEGDAKKGAAGKKKKKLEVKILFCFMV